MLILLSSFNPVCCSGKVCFSFVGISVGNVFGGSLYCQTKIVFLIHLLYDNMAGEVKNE